MEQELQNSDNREIVELLSTASEKWKSIGLQLGLSMSDLNKIGELPNSDPVNRLSAMIDEWLKGNGNQRTPKTLAEALKSKSVRERKLAESVENKYGKEEEVESGTDGQSSSGGLKMPPSSTAITFRKKAGRAQKTQTANKRRSNSTKTDGPSSKKRKQDTSEVEPPAEILYKTCQDHVFKCEECRERLLKTNADQQNNIPCKNAKEGCDWRGKSAEEHEAHTAVCPKKYVQCPFDEEFRCQKNFRREELNVHLQHHITSLHTQFKTCQCQTLPITFTIPRFQASIRHLYGRDNSDNILKEYKFPFYTHQGGYLMRLCITAKSRNGKCYIEQTMESMPGSYDDMLRWSNVTITGQMYSSKREKFQTFDVVDVALSPRQWSSRECGTPFNCDFTKIFSHPWSEEDFKVDISCQKN